MKLFILLLLILCRPQYLCSLERPDFLNKAILFQVSNLSPDNFKGGIGYQYSFSPDVSMRIPIGFRYFSEFQGKPENTASDRTVSQFAISFSPGVKYNFIMQTNLNIYTGIEAMFQLDNSYTTGENFKDNDVNKYSRAWGAAILLGAELFVYKNVSISAEYSLKFSKTTGENEYIVGNTTQLDKLPAQTSLAAGINNLGFILSFYFK